MLHQHEGYARVCRTRPKEKLKRFQTARRCADTDDGEVYSNYLRYFTHDFD